MPADEVQSVRGLGDRGLDSRGTDDRNASKNPRPSPPALGSVPAIGGRVTTPLGSGPKGSTPPALGEEDPDPWEPYLWNYYGVPSTEVYPRYLRRAPLVKGSPPPPPPPPPPLTYSPPPLLAAAPEVEKPLVFDEVDILGRISGRERETETMVFDGLTIFGRVVRPEKESPPPPEEKASPPPPPTYTAKALDFEVEYNYENPGTPVFAGPGWIVDIINVVNILNSNPKLHVTLKASVGVTQTGAILGVMPLGSTPKVYEKFGKVMDARANRVRDELVRWGISKDRIHPARGEAILGAAGRRVDFVFETR